MTFETYQTEAEKLAVYPHALEMTNLSYPTLGLAGEAGEVANEIKKIERDDDGRLTEERKQKLIYELGDVLWYLAVLATELDLSLDYIAQSNIGKLIQRRQERGR